MSERALDRLTKEDLLVAQPKGSGLSEGGHCTDLLYVPDAKEGTQVLTPYKWLGHGRASSRHKYERLGRRNREALYAIHVAFFEKRAGIYSSAPEEELLQFWDKDGENAKAWEDQAHQLSAVLKGRDVFVAATDHYIEGIDHPPGPRAAYYAAPVSEIVNMADDGTMQFEPVVVPIDKGEGLLPRGMWMYQGIYVPTSVQDLDLLKQQD